MELFWLLHKIRIDQRLKTEDLKACLSPRRETTKKTYLWQILKSWGKEDLNYPLALILIGYIGWLVGSGHCLANISVPGKLSQRSNNSISTVIMVKNSGLTSKLPCFSRRLMTNEQVAVWYSVIFFLTKLQLTFVIILTNHFSLHR